jgi:hypothetical protein
MFNKPKQQDENKPLFCGNAFQTSKGFIIKVNTEILDAELIKSIPFGKDQVETSVLTLYVQPNDPNDLGKGIWCAQLETNEAKAQEEAPAKKNIGK